MKLTKNELKTLIDTQKQMDESLEKIDTALGIWNEWWGWNITSNMFNTILRCLSVEDADWIEYYIYDCNYGTNDVRIEIDGIEKQFTFDVLWEVLNEVKES